MVFVANALCSRFLLLALSTVCWRSSGREVRLDNNIFNIRHLWAPFVCDLLLPRWISHKWLLRFYKFNCNSICCAFACVCVCCCYCLRQLLRLLLQVPNWLAFVDLLSRFYFFVILCLVQQSTRTKQLFTINSAFMRSNRFHYSI